MAKTNSSNSSTSSSRGTMMPAVTATGSKMGNATSAGGNLAGNQSAGTTATGFTANQVVPGANANVEQVGNTVQQALPTIVASGGVDALVTFGHIVKIRALINRIEAISQEYYDEFQNDATYWTNYYKPFLRDVYVQTAYRTLAYTGDGRGTASSNNNPDKDLFRRAQLAVQNTRELDIAWRTKRRLVSRYAHGAMRMDDLDTALQHMRIQIDNQLTAERMEDVYEDEFNNRKWNRLLMATNIGVTGTNAATQGYSTAMAAHIDSLRGMADYKSALGNQIASAAGNFIQSSFGD